MELRLLIAEAEPELRELFREFFSDYGFAVETAADGLECLARLRADRPDVLILGSDIPWGGGEGVLALLREEVDLLSVRVLFLIGCDPPESISERVGLPIGFCFQKPFRPTVLLDAVRSALAHRDLRVV